MENEIVDTAQSEAQTVTHNTETETTTETAQQQYVPFSAGKEKFKINGQEEEWDWETTKRYAQLGKAGQKAMQDRAESEKKQKDFFARLITGLEQDPEATYEALTGKKPSFTVRRAIEDAQQSDSNNQNSQNADTGNPLELRLRQTEERLQSILQQQEAQAIEKERQAIEQEIEDATKKFPELSTPWLKSYVRQQYKAALQSGMNDLSIEDVAFLVAEDVKRQNAEKQTALIQKVDENKKKAIVTAPRGTGQETKKSMSLEDVKRLAGRIT